MTGLVPYADPPLDPATARARSTLHRSDLERLPRRPVAYHQLLRGPAWRWWRAPLSLLCLVGALVVLLVAVFAGGDVLDQVLPGRLVGSADDDASPLGAALLDLTLASLIPASLAAVALAHWRRPRWLVSVAGRVRWRWLLRSTLVVLPLFVLYVGLGFLVDPPAPGRPEHWGQLLVLTLLLTPLQAAGEEFLFRGWLVQNVGGYFIRPVLGLVVSTAASAGLFALAHGSLHLWVLLDLGVFATSCCLLTWRTGGLEAGIAVHAMNNVVIGLFTVTYGGYAESYVDADTRGSPVELAGTVVVQAIAVALLWWHARRTGLVRRSPAIEPETLPELPDAIWIAPLGR